MLEFAALGCKHEIAQNSPRRLLELADVIQQLLQLLHVRLAVQTDVLEVNIQKGVNVEAELVTEVNQLRKQLLVLNRLSRITQMIILKQILLRDHDLAPSDRVATTIITDEYGYITENKSLFNSVYVCRISSMIVCISKMRLFR